MNMQSLASWFGWQEEESGSTNTYRSQTPRKTTPEPTTLNGPENNQEEDFWGKIQRFFKSEDDEEEEEETVNQSRKQSFSARNSIRERRYSKTAPLLSAHAKSQLYNGNPTPSLEKRNSISSSSGNKHLERLKMASSYIPDAFKQSFDLSYDIDDEKLNNGLGVLEFSTFYLFDKNTLYLKIFQATNLPAMDLFGASDPFVKCCLLPDRKRKLETKIKRKTLNPVWNEVLTFEGLAYEKIQQRVLYLQVFDYDRFSRNDPIGEICLPLHTIDLSQETRHRTPLQPCEKSNKRGELLLSLCYHPIEGDLQIIVKQGRNMKPMDLNGTSDPYVKVWLLSRDKKMMKKKTSIKKNTLNPNFHETFHFNVPMSKLRDVQFEITVMDYDTIGRNDTIGKIYLGHKSSGLEKQHWKDMLASTRSSVSQWHVLKI